jgi:hypothetical protein
MTEPTGCVRCCARGDAYGDGCDLLVGLPGLRGAFSPELGHGVGLCG